MVLGAGRASTAAADPAVAITADAASPATWTNSRLLVALVMTAPPFRTIVWAHAWFLDASSPDASFSRRLSDVLAMSNRLGKSAAAPRRRVLLPKSRA